MEGPLEMRLSYCSIISWSELKYSIHLATRGPYRAREGSSAVGVVEVQRCGSRGMGLVAGG